MNHKIEKLNERMDTIQMFMKKLLQNKELVEVQSDSDVQPLDLEEKKIFMVLYTSGESALSYKQIAEKVNMVENLVGQYITNLAEKGVPLIKVYRHGKAHILVDKSFRDLQAKENLLKIDQQILNF